MDQTPHSSISRESLAWTVCLQSVWEKSMGLNPQARASRKRLIKQEDTKASPWGSQIKSRDQAGTERFQMAQSTHNCSGFSCTSELYLFLSTAHLSCTIWYFPPNFCVIWILNPHWVLRKPLEKHRKKINLHSKDIWVGSHLKGVSFNAVLVCFQKSQVCNTKTLPVRKFSEWTT